jgi:hypothetical protein
MVVSNTPNIDALASPTYNPDIDPTTLKLFNAMGNNYPYDLVAQYRQIITNMPTVNPYSALLTNPRSCDISQAQTGLATAEGNLWQQYSAVVLAGTPVPSLTGGEVGAGPGQPGYIPSNDQLAQAAIWQQAMPEASASLDQAQSSMSDFQDHTDRLISNLPSILGMIQSALGIATAVGNLLNPCLGLSNFLGSILATGATMIARIIACIAQISEAGSDMSLIQAGLACVTGGTQSLLALIEAEIMALIKSLIDATRLGLSQLLSTLPKDPCFGAIMQTVGTGAALAILAGR